MKFLIYKSKKQQDFKLIEKISLYLEKNQKEYSVISEENLLDRISADFLIVIGGDGTILKIASFALLNSIPILSINTGNLGFITEFEKDDYTIALDTVFSNNFKLDYRSVLNVQFNDKNYYALNDAVIQRKYLEDYTNLVVKISAFLDDSFVDDIKGDGVIISTPTGSTAYSLSAGGSILAPNIKANSLTPICAHSFNNRPIIFSSDTKCELKVISGSISTLFIDGKSQGDVDIGDKVIITNCDRQIAFIRKIDNNFYKKLITKFSRGE